MTPVTICVNLRHSRAVIFQTVLQRFKELQNANCNGVYETVDDIRRHAGVGRILASSQWAGRRGEEWRDDTRAGSMSRRTRTN